MKWRDLFRLSCSDLTWPTLTKFLALDSNSTANTTGRFPHLCLFGFLFAGCFLYRKDQNSALSEANPLANFLGWWISGIPLQDSELQSCHEDTWTWPSFPRIVSKAKQKHCKGSDDRSSPVLPAPAVLTWRSRYLGFLSILSTFLCWCLLQKKGGCHRTTLCPTCCAVRLGQPW